ncbi:MAG: tRNA pseudouridine(55) synthase TruB, partial [Phycisphaerae bacterium]|nr:tRNA pseudouridine(55) synthase TruB [Phycisphaerae bacterium]
MNVYKPKGPTSHDVVVQVRRMLPRKTRVGHTGTLDPFAKGVLVLCVGQATRLAEFVQSQPKRYVAVIKLGAVSDTDDPEGTITPTPDATPPTEQQIRDVLKNFVGEIQQVPPAHSAIHIDGQRAYELAREGKDVEIPARPVKVFKLSMRRYEYPKLQIDVHCGSGT